MWWLTKAMAEMKSGHWAKDKPVQLYKVGLSARLTHGLIALSVRLIFFYSLLNVDTLNCQ